MVKSVKTVEYDPGFGWIARSPFDGTEIVEGFRWSSRSVARTVVNETARLIATEKYSQSAGRDALKKERGE